MITCIILVAGSGSRLGSNDPKQFIKVGTKTILEHCIERFLEVREIDNFIFACQKEYQDRITELLKPYSVRFSLIEGGQERFHSVANALEVCPQETDIVLIHDGARPNVKPALVKRLIKWAQKSNSGAIPGQPLTDSVKKVNCDGEVLQSVPRSHLYKVQTPQVFPYEKILDSYRQGLEKSFSGTDDAAFFEEAGERVTILEGEASNLKITYPEDLKLFEAYLKGIL